MIDILHTVNDLLWGFPLLCLILLVGIMYSVKTHFLQLRKLPMALRTLWNSFCKKSAKSNGVPAYRALCTALAATVGTGNLAGVAGAIAIGGPGAVFWMWVCAIFGMMIKFAEVVLAVHFREITANGEFLGGPMYMIKNGLPKRFHILASIYCFMGIVASFGVGNSTQINSVVAGIESILGMHGMILDTTLKLILGVVVAIGLYFAFQDGASRIGRIAEKLVPFSAALYIFLAIILLVFRASEIPSAFRKIFIGAVSPQAVTGGVIGSVFSSIRVGTARGIFTNEAGMGTASIAHAEACTVNPIRQGLLGITEVFIDTILICTLTALVVLCSGVTIPYGSDPGIGLTLTAFSNIYGQWSNIVVTLIACSLAIATILGWGLYGARCAQFLFGGNPWKWFAFTQAVVALVSCLMDTSVVWSISELTNGLLAIPNLIALIGLSPILMKEMKAYRL